MSFLIVPLKQTSNNCTQSEKILALTNAADVEIEPIWANLLAKALEGKDVKELLSNIGAGGGAPAAGAPAAAAGGAAAPEAAKEEEKKEEEKEESDDDMVCVLSSLSTKCAHSSAGLRSLRLSDSFSSSLLCLYSLAFSPHVIVFASEFTSHVLYLPLLMNAAPSLKNAPALSERNCECQSTC
jgi:large subunit ribosomal protein LP1